MASPPPGSTSPVPNAAEIDQFVEVDSDETDAESAYGSGAASDTTSLQSEVQHYKYENGRRYHAYAEGQYWGPNDEKQNEQLDIFHHVYSLVLDGDLYLAPITSHPQKILDIGTGTGIWAIDMADKFPSARVMGNDLSPIQPAWVPPNCVFEVDDFTRPWTYPKGTFDFIHGRALHGSIPNWVNMYKEAFATLKPGGWFESVETTVEYFVDGLDGVPVPVGKETAISEWCRLGNEAAEKIGRSFAITGKLAGWQREVGFVNVTERVFKVPCGPWAKDPRMKNIGRYNLLNLLEAIEGFTIALFTRVLNWEPEEVQVMLANVRAELQDRKNHVYYKMYVVYGQRPLDDEQ